FGSEHRSGFFLFTILLEDEVVVFRSVSSGSGGGRDEQLRNPYYHNTVFTKTSHMIDKDKLILEMAIGSRSNKRSWSMMKGSQK
uniref:Uncharacterized protein n=1 Tax=Brassica oleracea var. oleracea TaxID=109376 RepID=A0A0D3BEX5_BRAOL